MHHNTFGGLLAGSGFARTRWELTALPRTFAKFKGGASDGEEKGEEGRDEKGSRVAGIGRGEMRHPMLQTDRCHCN